MRADNKTDNISRT